MFPRRRQWHPTPVLLPGKSHGRRSLVGCSPWGRWGSDTTEWLDFHFSLSCIGEGNGNPLQCSCLENPRDGGAWRAAFSGVAQSRTRLRRLSSSSSNNVYPSPPSSLLSIGSFLQSTIKCRVPMLKPGTSPRPCFPLLTFLSLVCFKEKVYISTCFVPIHLLKFYYMSNKVWSHIGL